MGTSYEDQYTFFITSCSFLFRVRDVSDKVVEEIKKHFILNNFLFCKNRAIYEIMWKNIVELDRAQMTV